MKPLTQLTNVERGKLFAQLFPDQVAPFVAYLHHYTAAIIQSKEQLLKEPSNNPIISNATWVGLAERLAQVLAQYFPQKPGKAPRKVSAHLFADQLFDGYLAFVSNSGLGYFANVKETPDECRSFIACIGTVDPKPVTVFINAYGGVIQGANATQTGVTVVAVDTSVEGGDDPVLYTGFAEKAATFSPMFELQDGSHESPRERQNREAVLEHLKEMEL